ncbi:Flp pilus assembly protein TadD, contains TPR repeats [Serratia fonticola]|nr:Flp pilus assembly protein TadD, contains TPR repeats [Serratia fonticola]
MIGFLKSLLSKNIVSALSLFTLLTFSHQIFAANFEPGVTRDNIPYVKMSGEIVPGDAQQFRYILDQWIAKNAPIQLLDLNSNGGGVIESYLILQSVLNYRVSTIIMPGNHCISACVSIFAAGKQRYADPRSIVGVHRVSEADEDTATARSASIDMIKVYRELNIPDNIRLNMIETDPSMVYLLTLADKKTFNIVTQDTAAAIATVQQSALKTQVKTLSQGDRKLARSLNAQGIALINQKQYIQAIYVLEQSKKLTPTDAEVLGNLGYAY